LVSLILYLLAFFIPYSESLKSEIGPAEVSVPYVLATAGLGLLIVQKAAGMRRGLQCNLPILVFFLVYVGVSAAHLLACQFSGVTWGDYEARLVEQNGRLALSVIIAVYVMNAATERRQVERVLQIVAVTAAVGSAYGIYQVLGTFEGFYRPLLPHTASYGVAPGQVGASRAVATMKEPSYFAGFLVFSIIATFSCLLTSSHRSWQWRALFPLLGMQAVAMLLTTSTGGFVALAVGLTVFFMLVRSRVRHRAASYVVAAAACCAPAAVWLVLTFGGIRSQLTLAVLKKAGSVSAEQRATFLKAALAIFGDYPLLGIGAGNYGNYLPRYTTEFGTLRHFVPNNVYAEILCEAGAFAFIAFVVMISAVAVRTYGGWRRSALGDPLGAGLLSALAGMAVQFVAYPTFKMEFTWLLFGICVAYARSARGSTGQMEVRTRDAGTV